jgi:hypothetical protein
VETTPSGTGYLAADLLVSRTDAEALVARGSSRVARGSVDDDWLHAVADRRRLVIHPGARWIRVR